MFRTRSPYQRVPYRHLRTLLFLLLASTAFFTVRRLMAVFGG
jgi:hypothetical protein